MLVSAAGYFEPITKDEFIAIAKIHTMNEDTEFEINEYIEEKEKSGQSLTKADLHIFCKINNMEHESYDISPTQIKQIEADTIAPTKYPLTPFPDPGDYDPKDWFDLTDDHNYNITHNYKGEDKWFNLPLTKRRRDQFNEMREKQFMDVITSKSKAQHK